jgi:Zn/Cd-binding protein ZinT
MNTPVTLDAQALKALIKESVREVLKEEWFGMWQSVIPNVSDAEQAEINQSSGSPSDYKQSDFVNMTDWLNDEN